MASESLAGGRIAATFESLKGAGRKGLITYLVAGDPDAKTALQALHSCVRGGADLLEIGMPFSDPMSEGTAIQRGHARALAAGATTERLFDLVRDFRASDSGTPVVLMGYSNTVMACGQNEFVERAAAAGVDGLLIVDMPLEEITPLSKSAGAKGLDTVLLASPSTPTERIRKIAAAASGYLYYTSYKGVTGSDQLDTAETSAGLERVDTGGRLPLAVGFGIRDAATAATLAQAADAVVVGSVLVEYCAAPTPDLAALQKAVAAIRAGLDTGVRA